MPFQFINGVRRVLPPSLIEILDEPGPPPQLAGMSSVVQKLENAAISDPQYATQKQGALAASQTFGAPPISAVTSDASPASVPPPPPPPQATSYAPIAYNPAAPAAPEAVRHREKTPPPDEDPLNPLAVAVAYDYQKQPFTPGYPPQAQFPPGIASPGLPPSLGSPGLAPPHFGSASHHPGMIRAATMPAHAGMASPGLASPYGISLSRLTRYATAARSTAGAVAFATTSPAYTATRRILELLVLATRAGATRRCSRLRDPPPSVSTNGGRGDLASAEAGQSGEVRGERGEAGAWYDGHAEEV